jgi:hypothetical protein
LAEPSGEAATLLAGDERYDLVVVDRVVAHQTLRRVGRRRRARSSSRTTTPRGSPSARLVSAGPRRDDVATELTLAAPQDCSRSAPAHRALMAGFQSLLNTGQPLRWRAAMPSISRPGTVHLDLSAQEAAVATGPGSTSSPLLPDRNARRRPAHGAPRASTPAPTG